MTLLLSSAPAGRRLSLRVHAEKTDSVNTSVALILFIRGSENYLLTRRLNKSAAIINYKQVARRNLQLFAVYFLSQSESELDLKLPFSDRSSRSSLSETHFKFLLFLLHQKVNFKVNVLVFFSVNLPVFRQTDTIC